MIEIHQNWNHPEYPDHVINQSLTTALNHTELFSLATINSETSSPTSWINTAYFSFTPDLTIFFLTPETTKHSQNLASNNSAAVNVFDTNQSGAHKLGIQLFGHAHKTHGHELRRAAESYTHRYPDTGEYVYSLLEMVLPPDRSVLYAFHPEQIKIFDERTFGPETWVTVEKK